MTTLVEPSRYKRTPLYLIRNDVKQGAPRMGFRRVLPPTILLRGAIEHTLRPYQTVQDVAVLFYGNPVYWSVIMDANPQAGHPMDLQPGAVLLIPPPATVRAL